MPKYVYAITYADYDEYQVHYITLDPDKAIEEFRKRKYRDKNYRYEVEVWGLDGVDVPFDHEESVRISQATYELRFGKKRGPKVAQVPEGARTG